MDDPEYKALLDGTQNETSRQHAAEVKKALSFGDDPLQFGLENNDQVKVEEEKSPERLAVPKMEIKPITKSPGNIQIESDPPPKISADFDSPDKPVKRIYRNH